jgi:hypothetical protein
MPRIRSIKPELFVSPQVMNLSRDARLLFIGLITQADDEGRGTADPRKLKAAIFGGDDDITTDLILELLTEIEKQNLCITYDGNGHGRIYALPSFREHQYIQRPKPSTYPKPPKQELTRASRSRVGSRNHIGSAPDEADTGIGGSDRILGSDRIGSEGSDRIGSQTRARAVAHDPVDNSDGRAPAPDGLKKPAERREENREKLAGITGNLAAAAKL